MTLATVKNIEYGRAHKVLKKAPAHRHVKCIELLKEQAFLVDRLVTVRCMLNALTDTDPQPIQTQSGKVCQLRGGASPKDKTVSHCGRA